MKRTTGSTAPAEHRVLGFTKASLDAEESRRFLMLVVTTTAGVFFTLAMGVVDMVQNHTELAIINWAMSIALAGLFLLLRFSKNISLTGHLGIFAVALYFHYLFWTGGSDISTVYWLMAFPIVVLFLTGAARGSIIYLSWYLVNVGISVAGERLPGFDAYPRGALLRFFGASMVAYVLSLVFEVSRLRTQKSLEESRKHLNDLAYRDGLTGLHNRRFLNQVVSEILRQMKRTGSHLAFLMFDLDHFKLYNDTYGHRAGDSVIAGFGGLLESSLRRDTDYAFRYGGEEFSLFLTHTNRDTAIAFAERILEDTRNLAIPHEKSPFGIVTVSVGVIVTAVHPNLDLTDLIEGADRALYEAKDAGRDRFVLVDMISAEPEPPKP